MHSSFRLSFGLMLIMAGLLLFFTQHLAHIGVLIVGLMLWAGAVLLALLYLRDDSNWWAMIPAGILLTVGTLFVLSAFNLAGSHMRKIIFFSGLALTFFYLWSQRNSENSLNWSIFPALVAGIAALLLLFRRAYWLDGTTLIAAGIIIFGGWFLLKALRA